MSERLRVKPFSFLVPIWKKPWMWCGGDTYVSNLVESVGGEVTRVAEATYVESDAALPATTFDFEFPEGTTVLY